MATYAEIEKTAVAEIHTVEKIMGYEPRTDKQILEEIRAEGVADGSSILGTLKALDVILNHMPRLPQHVIPTGRICGR